MAIVLYAIALLLIVKKIFYAQSRKEVAFLLAFIAAAVLLALYERADLSVLLLGTLIFNGIASSFRSRESYAYIILAVLFMIPTYQLSALIVQAMLLGLLSGAYFFMKPNDHRDLVQERRRDMVQVGFGLMLIGAFVFFPGVFAKLFLAALVVLACLLGNYAVSNNESQFYKIALYFERKNAALGQGAFWLAVGSLLATSFLSSTQTIAVLGAIFLGDAAATLVGTRYKLSLPYNRKKSVYGTAAYFVVSSLFSFPFVGQIGVLTSLVAALVEGAESRVDDNFDTAFALTVFIKILNYTGLI